MTNHLTGFLIALAVLMALPNDTRAAQRVLFAVAEKTPVSVTVEVARTEADWTRGLMHRKHLAENAGMLFIFPDEERRQFWMKNTLISLDMIFLDHDRRIVGIVENATPGSLEPRFTDRPSRFVLEVRGGFSRRHGLKMGLQAEFSGFDIGS